MKVNRLIGPLESLEQTTLIDAEAPRETKVEFRSSLRSSFGRCR